MKKFIVFVLFVLLSVVYILFDRDLPPYPNAILKALPLVLLMVALLTSRSRQSSRAEWDLPFIALLFSIAGDTAGEIPLGKDKLLLMMLFFGIAHFFYIVSFLRHFNLRRNMPAKIILANIVVAFAVGLVWMLSSHIGNHKLFTGVIVYASLLGLMCITCLMQERRGHWLMFAGTVLFLVSDSLLVIHRFVSPVPARAIIVMATYYAAQLFINIPIITGRRR